MNAKSLVKVKYAEGVIEYNTTFARMMENPLSDELRFSRSSRWRIPSSWFATAELRRIPRRTLTRV